MVPELVQGRVFGSSILYSRGSLKQNIFLTSYQLKLLRCIKLSKLYNRLNVNWVSCQCSVSVSWSTIGASWYSVPILCLGWWWTVEMEIALGTFESTPNRNFVGCYWKSYGYFHFGQFVLVFPLGSKFWRHLWARSYTWLKMGSVLFFLLGAPIRSWQVAVWSVGLSQNGWNRWSCEWSLQEFVTCVNKAVNRAQLPSYPAWESRVWTILCSLLKIRSGSVSIIDQHTDNNILYK